MLALARLEESPMESGQSSDLQSAVQSIAGRLRPLAELKQVSLEVSAGDTCNVAMQPDDAEVLCSNLIMNALQHSLPTGRVCAGRQAATSGAPGSESICKAVVERSNGAIQIRSTVGTGTEVTVTLPVANRVKFQN
jgi:signal transduction histidine kinase